MRWVIDASVTLAWCFEEDGTHATEALFDRVVSIPVIVPQLWSLEVGNALVIGTRRGRIDASRRSSFLKVLDGLPIHVDADTAAHALKGTIDLADRHRLTVYDAAYLELAIRRQLPLATLDADLRAAAAAAGVPLL